MPIYAYHCNVTQRGTALVYWLFAGLFFFTACATIVSPSGGEKDTRAPLVIKRSPADSALQMRGGQWRIDFNEFIKLQDAQREVRITPLLAQQPKITAHKNRLSINIPDSLIQANTTYRIDFGQAVRDIHESNPAKDLHLTFSSGTYFDSLQLKVKCIQAQNGLMDTGVVLMLYPVNTPDSLLLVNKPMYVEKNTAEGCVFRNLPRAKFKVVALQDANNNYKRDALSDRVAFHTSDVQVGSDTGMLVLYSFAEATAESNTKGAGMGRMKPKALPTLNYSVLVDTGNVAQRRFNFYDTLKVVFNRVPQQLQVQSMRLYGDSVLEAEASLKPTRDSLTYFVQHQWQENTLYRLVFSNAFVADTNGQFLAQREYRFRSKQNSDYGLLRLHVNPNPTAIWQLVRNDTLIAAQVAGDSLLVFDHVLPGQYTIRCHVDANQNGVWDNGSWPKRQLPERVVIMADRILVKSNWENTLNMRGALTP